MVGRTNAVSGGGGKLVKAVGKVTSSSTPFAVSVTCDFDPLIVVPMKSGLFNGISDMKYRYSKDSDWLTSYKDIGNVNTASNISINGRTVTVSNYKDSTTGYVVVFGFPD